MSSTNSAGSKIHGLLYGYASTGFVMASRDSDSAFLEFHERVGLQPFAPESIDSLVAVMRDPNDCLSERMFAWAKWRVWSNSSEYAASDWDRDGRRRMKNLAVIRPRRTLATSLKDPYTRIFSETILLILNGIKGAEKVRTKSSHILLILKVDIRVNDPCRMDRSSSGHDG